jgi:hypothetical protein
MSEETTDISQQISVTSLMVAMLKTLKSVEVPSELVLNPEGETSLIVSYNADNNTFIIALGENNGSNNNEQLQDTSELGEDDRDSE